RSGDLLCFYSDGVTEAKNFSGEMFGEERLAQFVMQNSEANPEQLLEKIREAVNDFLQTESLTDDFTCLAVKITDVGPQIPRPAEVMSTGIKLALTSDLQELSRVRQFIRQACVETCGSNIDEDTVNDLLLTVNEAITNVILHAYQSVSGLPVELQFEADSD